MPTAVSHDAVSYFQHRLEYRGRLRFDVHSRLQEFDHAETSFQTPSKIKEFPAAPTRHILHFHAVEGSQIEDQVVNKCSGTGEWKPPRTPARVGFEPAENAPGIAREAVAYARSNKTDSFQQFAHGARRIWLVEKLEHLPR